MNNDIHNSIVMPSCAVAIYLALLVGMYAYTTIL